MEYEIRIRKKCIKFLKKADRNIRERFDILARILRDRGATGPHEWPHYGKIGANKYHCHPTYRYVACWHHEHGTIEIEV